MSEFDRQVAVLAKVLNENLNEREFASERKGAINKLHDFLDWNGFDDPQRSLEVLRRLQGLRSYGAVHRKSSDYFKKSGVDGFARTYTDLLVSVAQTLTDLLEFIETASEGGVLGEEEE